MPTKDKVKNQEYVAKHRTNLRASLGDEAYKKQEAEARKIRRQKAKANKIPASTSDREMPTPQTCLSNSWPKLMPGNSPSKSYLTAQMTRPKIPTQCTRTFPR